MKIGVCTKTFYPFKKSNLINMLKDKSILKFWNYKKVN